MSKTTRNRLIPHSGRGAARIAAVVLAAAAMTGVGCRNAATGGAVGAGAGALAGLGIGSLTGSAGKGAAIGAIAGGIGGAIIGDQNKKADERAGYDRRTNRSRYDY